MQIWIWVGCMFEFLVFGFLFFIYFVIQIWASFSKNKNKNNKLVNRPEAGATVQGWWYCDGEIGLPVTVNRSRDQTVIKLCDIKGTRATKLRRRTNPTLATRGFLQGRNDNQVFSLCDSEGPGWRREETTSQWWRLANRGWNGRMVVGSRKRERRRGCDPFLTKINKFYFIFVLFFYTKYELLKF